MTRINVTKTFLPPKKEYQRYVDQIWAKDQLTNQGPLVLELERQLENYLGIKNLHFVNNGTMALQIALRALGITGSEVITTPFTYVATTSSILWEHCTPVFVDIDPSTLCIDVEKIEAAITPNTKAIMPVHVFGNVCDVEKIASIAKKHDLKIIYDAAHSFGVKYKGKSVFSYGDISVGSFHATKLFHTIEGGCLVVKDRKISKEVELIKRFGHDGDKHFRLGINGKVSEFHAAMGLVNLRHMARIFEARKEVVNLYNELLNEDIQRPQLRTGVSANYAYYPIILKDEKNTIKVLSTLQDNNIFPRRYFYPSLNKLPYIDKQFICSASEDIAKRIICLPLYVGLETKWIKATADIINQVHG